MGSFAAVAYNEVSAGGGGCFCFLFGGFVDVVPFACLRVVFLDDVE